MESEHGLFSAFSASPKSAPAATERRFAARTQRMRRSPVSFSRPPRRAPSFGIEKRQRPTSWSGRTAAASSVRFASPFVTQPSFAFFTTRWVMVSASSPPEETRKAMMSPS
ncbi:MAG: hypothetical protein PUE63_03300 [Lachnospiraceae bacterium]|nr:hypothetical protein [Lachnospiraceae bacterium]